MRLWQDEPQKVFRAEARLKVYRPRRLAHIFAQMHEWCEALSCEIEIEAALRGEINNLSKMYDSNMQIVVN